MRNRSRVALTVVAAFGLAGCASPEASKATAAATPTSVRIINGAGRADVCRDVATRLGVPAATPLEPYKEDGRLDYSRRETLIMYGAKDGPAAEEVRAKLGVGKVVPSASATSVDVVVGWDAAPGLPPGAPADGVLIRLGDKAIYWTEGGVLKYVWPCAVGKPETATPTGAYQVTCTLEDPTWYWQGKAIPPGPENGLGKWFIGINKKGYGIHGTNEPASIGTAASHGCVRMYNEDAGALAALVKAGTTVIIAD